MSTPELHISKRLQAVLPPLTDDERAQLRANILADGEITNPLIYWHDGKRNVVVDGMHRFAIARGEELPYSAKPVTIGETYEEAELWILNRQLGQRNLLTPQAIRKIRGELYNRLKSQQGGDHTSREASAQNAHLLGGAAQKIAEKAGVDPATIRRDGARIAALNKCIPAVQKGINSNTFTATDAQIKALAKATPEKQNAVAKAARSGTPLETAMAEQKVGTAKPKKPPAQGKCPVCAKTKWTEDEDGVICAKCRHPHGEPAGDPDEDRLNTQRQKTRKTVDALMRAFDDLQTMHAHTCNPCQLTEDDSKDPIRCCKRLLAIGKAWK